MTVIPRTEAPWSTAEQAARARARAALQIVAHTLHRHDASRSYFRSSKHKLDEAVGSTVGKITGPGYECGRALQHLRTTLLAYEALLQMSGEAILDRQPALRPDTEKTAREECYRRLQLAESLLLKWEGSS
jgi:hypothetical protein